MNIERLEVYFPQRYSWSIHAHDNRLTFCQSLTYVSTTRLRNDAAVIHRPVRLECYTMMTLSVDNWRGPTFYLPKQQPVRNLYTLYVYSYA